MHRTKCLSTSLQPKQLEERSVVKLRKLQNVLGKSETGYCFWRKVIPLVKHKRKCLWFSFRQIDKTMQTTRSCAWLRRKGEKKKKSSGKERGQLIQMKKTGLLTRKELYQRQSTTMPVLTSLSTVWRWDSGYLPEDPRHGCELPSRLWSWPLLAQWPRACQHGGKSHGKTASGVWPLNKSGHFIVLWKDKLHCNLAQYE